MTIAPAPDAQSILDRLAAQQAMTVPPDHLRGTGEWVAQYRDGLLGMADFSGPPQPVFVVQTHRADGPDGPLDLRLYRPAPGITGAIVFLHGGGLIAGSLETHDPALRALANASGWVVVAVNYRLAPEYPFPAAPEDAYAALCHVAAHTDTLGVDATRLVLMGDSAGGTLAAAAALMARDRRGPSLAGLTCLYPNTDLRPGQYYGSRGEYDGVVVKLDELFRGLALYLPPGCDPAHPYASPLLADLGGLPPALIATCECDPLRDEGEAFAAALRAAGGVVKGDRLPAMIHGALQMAADTEGGRHLMDVIVRWLNGLATRPAAAR